MKKIIGRFLGAVAAMILLAALALALALASTLPPRHDRVTIPGLSAPVSVTFDQDGIPRIRAASLADAVIALGYVHARDRLFQMDLMRREASGRLSELFGSLALGVDREARILGWEPRAEADYAHLPPDTRALLAAYARGVNAFIARRGRFAAPEFLLFGAPQPWRPTDSLLWGKTMQSWLSYNARTELSRLALEGMLPAAEISELWPAPDPAAAAADGMRDRGARSAGDARLTDAAALAGAARRLLAALPAFPDRFTQPAPASNEWAVAGSRTRSGAPLLAGDPHLDLNYPALWYLVRIDTPDQSLAGATGPGLPFLVIGHNRRIAWTFTTTGADTEDVFEEKLLPDGRYQTPQGPARFTTRREVIHVKGSADVVMTVRGTRHGPVLSDADSGAAPAGTVLALAASYLAPGDTAAAGILALDRAGSVAEAGLAAAEISAPVQNMLVADRRHIALFTTGSVPVRRSGDGAAPVEGADAQHDWIGVRRGPSLPHFLDPVSGALINGNERTAPPNFPVYLGRDAYGDWRAQRIRALLGTRRALTVADFAHIQMDDVSTLARALLPRLRAGAPAGNGLAARAARLLMGWDGTMDQTLPQPLIYNAWLRAFYAMVLARAGAGEGAGPWAEFTQFVLSPAGSHWCGGDCTNLLRRALDRATASLAARYGDDPARWRWGQAHRAQFIHPVLGLVAWLRPLAGFEVAMNGDDQTVLRGGSTASLLTDNHGPALRGIDDLADLDGGSRFIVAPGQSGNLLSRHAGDLLARWRRGDAVALGPTPQRVEATLSLTP